MQKWLLPNGLGAPYKECFERSHTLKEEVVLPNQYGEVSNWHRLNTTSFESCIFYLKANHLIK